MPKHRLKACALYMYVYNLSLSSTTELAISVDALVLWIDNNWFEIYQLRQSTTNEGFDPGMCLSDPTLGREISR